MSIATRDLLITAVLSVVISAVTLAGLSLVPASAWDAMRPATCLPTACFCEAPLLTESIRQPVNAVSSLAYVLSGAWILVTAGQIAAGVLFGVGHRIIMGLSAIVIGVGSTYYHGSLTFAGQFFDILGMYLFAALLLIYALQRLYRWSFTTTALVYIAFNVTLTLVQIGVPDTRRYVFGIVLALALLAEAVVWRVLRPIRTYAWFWAGIGVFAVAMVVWALDLSAALCDPSSLIQGHAIWHVLGAVAVFCTWKWHASEPAP
ncbi:MAG: ceramidase domain-containing protein [Chloroflexi bacterium]|nr:hypothetical protein [Chloroflexota bacterium]MBV6435239.1 hypothetical protein [Anaerolineae bacterium]MDL1915616.1 hypothetical protein [Anaerolineae bacterium CFX4]OQY83716.1 MAG: hypothetical protein B6D42_07015 [Anaerolineae bacterium UTCFX5]MBW7880066.1 ceramidase domain-containing protein [Anaerolineae bacterium]